MSFRINLTPKQWKAVEKWNKTFRNRIKGAMWEALAILEGQMKVNLSGPSHSLFPGNGNPFPGAVTGVGKNSVTSEVRETKRDMEGVVGPGPIAPYMVRHFMGWGVKKRDFIRPTFHKKRVAVRKVFKRAIQESLA